MTERGLCGKIKGGNLYALIKSVRKKVFAVSSENSPKMIEKKIPSAYPYWITGLFWLVYSLVFPLYKIPHFAIAAILSIAVFFISKKLIPPKTVMVEAPKEPAYSGRFDIGQTQRDYLEKLRDAYEKIENEDVRKHVNNISNLSKSIFEYVSDKPDRVNEIRRFTAYYLPTAIKILDAYDRMEEQSVKGTNITQTLDSIENALAKMEKAFEAQLDSLYSAEKLDIETDIEVMEAMLAQEGIITPKTNEIELRL